MQQTIILSSPALTVDEARAAFSRISDQLEVTRKLYNLGQATYASLKTATEARDESFRYLHDAVMEDFKAQRRLTEIKPELF